MPEKLLHIDTETTGLFAPGAGLIQVAGIVEIDGEEVEAFDFRCRPYPGDLLSKEALEVTGHTREEIEAYPDPESVFHDFIGGLDDYVDRFDKADKFHLVAYNAGFDSDHLRAWFKKAGDNFFGAYFWTPPLCTMCLAGLALRSKRAEMPNFKLATVAETLGVTADGNTHDALTDVRLSAGIYRRLMDAATKKGILQ